MTALRAYAYTRQSKARNEDEGDSLSCAMQEHQIRQWADKAGYELVRVYRDQDFTGRNDQRPAFQQMFTAIRDGHDPVQAVITYKFARFARKVRVFATYHGELSDRGIDLLSTTESSDTRMVQVSALMADWYSTDLSEFTSAAIRHKLRRGAWHGNVPVGYVKDSATQRLVPDPVAAAFVAEVFDRFAAGDTIVGLLRWIHDDPALAPVREGRTWSRQTLHRLLGRRTYLGHTSGMEHAHPPIVDDLTFQRVQKRRAHPVRYQAKAISSPLEGLVTCGACGQPMRLSTVQRPDLPCGHSRHWRCASLNRQYGYGERVASHQRMYRADWIEDAVRAAVARDVAHVLTFQDALSAAKRDAGSQDTDRRRIALLRQRGKVEAGRERLLGVFRDGRLDPDRWEVADRDVAAELATIDRELSTLPSPPDPSVFADAARLLGDLAGAIGLATDRADVQSGLDAELRRLLIAVDARVSIDGRPPMRGRSRVEPSVTVTYGDPAARFIVPS